MARKSDSGGMVFKTGMFAILAGIAFWIFNRSSSTPKEEAGGVKTDQTPTAPNPTPAPVLPDYLPLSTTNDIIAHRYFTLSYSEDHEQAEWVAYEVTRTRLNDNWVDRSVASFKPDPQVRTESATPRDYTGSGYDRGHLCPAADMAFDTIAMSETFYMSNMSPQARAFNAGIWRELEELTRDWGRKYQKVYVVTGPLLSQPGIKQIGLSKVTVPVGFYRVLYAPDAQKAIGFIMPNQRSERPVMEYAFSVDYVEEKTGLDFFPTILKDAKAAVESKLEKEAWPVNEKRFAQRLTDWNR
jgi:endonuclease G, mitochondrial